MSTWLSRSPMPPAARRSDRRGQAAIAVERIEDCAPVLLGRRFVAADHFGHGPAVSGRCRDGRARAEKAVSGGGRRRGPRTGAPAGRRRNPAGRRRGAAFRVARRHHRRAKLRQRPSQSCLCRRLSGAKAAAGRPPRLRHKPVRGLPRRRGSSAPGARRDGGAGHAWQGGSGRWRSPLGQQALGASVAIFSVQPAQLAVRGRVDQALGDGEEFVQASVAGQFRRNDVASRLLAGRDDGPIFERADGPRIPQTERKSGADEHGMEQRPGDAFDLEGGPNCRPGGERVALDQMSLFRCRAVRLSTCVQEDCVRRRCPRPVRSRRSRAAVLKPLLR